MTNTNYVFAAVKAEKRYEKITMGILRAFGLGQ